MCHVIEHKKLSAVYFLIKKNEKIHMFNYRIKKEKISHNEGAKII